MIKVYVEDNEMFGPVVLAVKGTRSAAEWIAREVQQALCFRCDGTLSLDWQAVDFPPNLRKRINLVQLAA